MDLYIFLESNAPWIDDGTRMPEKDRNVLSGIHHKGFKDAGIKVQKFDYYGDYGDRLKDVIKYIDEYLAKF
jgi:HTH-type transcriptional repressor of NAD biosynthesis genes